MTAATISTNAIALARGYRFRLEIGTANGGRAGHEFTVTTAEARERMRALRAAGYTVTAFRITVHGGLDHV